MTDSQKIRSLLPFLAIAILSSLSLYLSIHNQTISLQNKDLSEKSKALGNSLKEAKDKAEESLGKSRKSLEEKDLIEAELGALKKEYESFQIETQKMETQWKAAGEEKTYLEEMLLNKTKAIELLKKNPLQFKATGTVAGENELVEQIRQKDEEIKKLDEQNKILAEKLQHLYQTTRAKIGEINAAKIALEETVSSARAKIDEEWNTVNLGSISMNQNPPAGRQATDKKEPRKISKKEGRVLAFNEEHGFVVVDLGKIDHLNTETALQIKKDNEVVATLSILEIRDEMSACNITSLKNGMRIQVNDPVFTS